MKRYIFSFAVMAVLGIAAVSSCVKNPDPVKPDPTLDLSFKFQTRKDMNITVSAVNENGGASAGVLFSIFAENPYSEDGERISSLLPIYQGYTEQSGNVKIVLPVPNSASSLYVVPVFAGYGSMVQVDATQNTASVELKGAQFAAGTKAVTLAEDGPIERERVNCGNNYKFYRYFQEGVDYEASLGTLLDGSELVSQEAVSGDIKDLIETWFPEQNDYYDSSLCTDLVVNQDGTKIWMTFIGDGGYTNPNGLANDLNSVMYYTYFDESELPDFSKVSADNYFKSGVWNITYAFMNINPRYTPCGTKVQLLYWNGEKYVEEFPAGVKVGFAFLKQGYGILGQTAKFSLRPEFLKPSTPIISRSRESYAAILRSDANDCYFMGMDFASGTDRDYNEALMMIQTTPSVSQRDVQQIPGTDTEVCCTYEGTLAFEDLWPYVGDYDFNDFVTDYKYVLYKVKGTNNIASVEMTFTPKALGATKDSGFGIEVPFADEPITVFANTRVPFGNVQGCINTFESLEHIESTPETVVVDLPSPMAETLIPFSSFNPFLFSIDNRGKEIHLVDHEPTSLADLSLLGTGVDKSYAPDGVYYRMDNKFPWALDIASTGLYSWKYPLEMVNITNAYYHYSEWVNDHDASWFDWTEEGNADSMKLY